MENKQLSPETESLINQTAAANRGHDVPESKPTGQTQITYWLQPRLHSWIEHHILDVSGWTWRHFTEAAILAVLSPEWPHLTWWENYIALGMGNRPIDQSRMIGWTPFLDEIPHARTHIAGIEPYPNPKNEKARTPEQVGTCSNGLDIRRDVTQQPITGYVYISWFRHTHEFLAELGQLTPVDNSADTHQSRARRGIRPLSPSAIARMCINAHFEPRGVPVLRECQFQVWREYCAMRAGYQGHVPQVRDVYARLQRAELVQTSDPRVPLWAAAQGDHLNRVQQFECGFWPDRVWRRFVEPRAPRDVGGR